MCSSAEKLQLQSPIVPHKKIDVIVTEIFDCAFFGEHVLSIMHQTWNNLMSQSGILNSEDIICIPMKATVYAVAVESRILKRSLNIHQNINRGLKMPDVCVGRRDSATYENFMLSSNLETFAVLSKPEVLYEINFQKLRDSTYSKSFEIAKTSTFEFECSGSFDAIVVYFDVHLSESFRITTNPVEKECYKCWGQAVFPSGVNNKLVGADSRENFNFAVQNLTDLSIRTVDFDPLVDEIFWTDDSHFISCLNNSKFFELTLRDFCLQNNLDNFSENSCAFLVLSEPSLLPFYLLSELKFFKIYIELIIESEETKDMFIKFCGRVVLENNLSQNSIQFIESFDHISSGKPSLVYFDLIHLSGKLNEVALQKFSEMKPIVSDTIVVPRILNVYCHLVDSEELASNNEILTDSNLCGVEMKNTLEMFRSTSVQSVDLNFVQYNKIADVFQVGSAYLFSAEIFEFEFEIEAEKMCSLKYPVLLFSYGVQFATNSSAEITTHDVDNDFKLCGVSLLNELQSIKTSTDVKLKAVLQNGIFTSVII